MPKVISATEARIRFGELMRLAVEKGEVVIVARGGKPYVTILPFSEYKRLREREKERGWKESLKKDPRGRCRHKGCPERQAASPARGCDRRDEKGAG